MDETRCYRCRRPLYDGRYLCAPCWQALFDRCVRSWFAAKNRDGTERRRRWRRKRPPRS
jgi:predicted amidophosphoribosyltransferase